MEDFLIPTETKYVLSLSDIVLDFKSISNKKPEKSF